MASRGSDIGQGAASGAATGTTILPGWGTIIGGTIGAIGGYFNSLQARDKEREQQRLEEKIQNMLSVRRYNKLYGKYLPIIRSQIAAGIGPAIQQKTASQISQHGLTGTGLGEVLRSLSVVAPGIEAQQQASAMARNTQLDRARALGAQISRRQDVNRSNPILAALAGGAGGAFSGYQMDEAMGRRRPVLTQDDYANLFPTMSLGPFGG